MEQDAREEIEELKEAGQEIDRKMEEKQRVVDSAINRIENNSEKMEVLKKSWGEEFEQIRDAYMKLAASAHHAKQMERK